MESLPRIVSALGISTLLAITACADRGASSDAGGDPSTPEEEPAPAADAGPPLSPPDSGRDGCHLQLPEGLLSAPVGGGACLQQVGYRCVAPDQVEKDERFCPLCSNSCIHAQDGECDDGGESSTTSKCTLGTDCADCGERWLGPPGEKYCDGDVEVSTDQALKASFDKCTRINGWLRISGQVSDLSPLKDLKEVYEEVVFDETNALTAVSLPNLTSVGHLELWYTSGLASVALPRLSEITGNKSTCMVLCGGIKVYGNSTLKQFDLPQLRAASLQIEDNGALAAVGPFNALSGATLWLRGNPQLAKLEGFPALASADIIDISGNGSLGFIHGFPALQTLSDRLDIVSNNALTEIEGFDSLRTVKGELRIEDNPVLTTIDAFPKIKDVGAFYCGGAALPESECSAIEVRVAP